MLRECECGIDRAYFRMADVHRAERRFVDPHAVVNQRASSKDRRAR